jgi:LPS-assembly lipoprotein
MVSIAGASQRCADILARRARTARASWRRFVLPFLALVLGTVLVGCGWHLAGVASGETPLGKVFVRGEGGAAKAIRGSLRYVSGATLVDVPNDAEVQIVVLREGAARRIVALSGTGRAREFEIIYTVQFVVRDVQRTLIEPNDIELRNQVSYDDSVALAKEQEIETLVQNMQRDAATQIIRRTSAVRR